MSQASLMSRCFLGTFMLLAFPAWAQSVALKGISGSKALISVNGSAPKFYPEGSRAEGVFIEKITPTSVIFKSVEDRFELRVGDTRANKQGEAPAPQNWVVNTAVSGKDYRASIARTWDNGANSLSIRADRSGHYINEGMINDQKVLFLVDTGASSVSMPASIARKLNLDYKTGKKMVAQTAGGMVNGYLVILDSVKLGELELRSVEASILDSASAESNASSQHVLLGMSFLSRLKMTADKNQLTLEKP